MFTSANAVLERRVYLDWPRASPEWPPQSLSFDPFRFEFLFKIINEFKRVFCVKAKVGVLQNVAIHFFSLRSVLGTKNR